MNAKVTRRHAAINLGFPSLFWESKRDKEVSDDGIRSSTTFLNSEEVKALTYPLTQPAAIRNHLTKLGLRFVVSPSGFPVVWRPTTFISEVDNSRPNRAALQEKLDARRKTKKNWSFVESTVIFQVIAKFSLPQ